MDILQAHNVTRIVSLTMSIVFALSLAVSARELCDDFTENWDPFDGDPVAWHRVAWDNGVYGEAQADGCGRGGLNIGWRSQYWDGVLTDKRFEGDVSVRVRASFAGNGGTVILLIHFADPGVAGYHAALERSSAGLGTIRLVRWDNVDSAHRLTSTEFPAFDPCEELELELSTTGSAIRFDVHVVGDEGRRAAVETQDPTYRSGHAGFEIGESVSARFHSVCITDDSTPPSGADFVRGDSNEDGNVDLADAVHVLNSLFAGGPPPSCADSADVNDDGAMNIADPVFLLNHLFAGDAAPPAPYPECGVDPTDDPTDDPLDCELFDSCP